MRKHSCIVKALTALLSVGQCMSVSAGTWFQSSKNEWQYRNDDGTLATGFIFDTTDQKWYYLNANGVACSGWQFINNKWYFFNPVHDGTFGSMSVNKWQWIDGYCYFFNADGTMSANGLTPDGYTVNADGQWIENGQAVYVAGKGINTKNPNQLLPGSTAVNSSGSIGHLSSGGGGGGGSSSGGGGSSSGGSSGSHSSSSNNSSNNNTSSDNTSINDSSEKTGNSETENVYYAYKVVAVDENGNVLKESNGTALKDSAVNIEEYKMDGYTFNEGQIGVQIVSSANMTFTLKYTKNTSSDNKADETCQYTIQYLDKADGTVIKAVTKDAVKGSVIDVTADIKGYTFDSNERTFTITKDKQIIEVYMNEETKTYSYTILYVDKEGNNLATVNGKDKSGSVIEIEKKKFDNYTMVGKVSTFTLDKDNKQIKVVYKKIEDTGKEDSETEYLYTIKYIDKDTEEVKLTEKNKGNKNAVIKPLMKFSGYQYAADYKFELTEDDMVFKAYLVKIQDESSTVKTDYTVTCVDANSNTIKVYTGSVETDEDGTVITPDYKISGYKRTGNNEFTVKKGAGNSFILEYTEAVACKINYIDIDTNATVETVSLNGIAGEEISISDNVPEGYITPGNPPKTLKVSALESNNSINIYVKKKQDIDNAVKKVNYTIQFRDYDDNDVKVLNDITGTWNLDENIPVYFLKEVTGLNGILYKTADSSPRVFRLKDQEMNTFTITFKKQGQKEVADTVRQYSIKYVAEDTDGVLGITTGIGNVGDIISYRNTWKDYGFADTSNVSFTLQEDEDDNTVTVKMARAKFPGHTINEHTNQYDGFEWVALFVDSNGNQLLPSVSGHSVDDDTFYIDYPDVIEADGVTYRAVDKSPYKEVINGTVYKQFIIQYVTGEPSEEKLAKWQQSAQQKKDLFYNTEPRSYYVAYKEKNSWNDIGLVFGVANKNTEVQIEAKEMDGWVVPSENLGHFKLTEDGQNEIAQYERSDNGTSIQYISAPYTVNILDQDGNNIEPSYTGKVALVKKNQEIAFNIYYPEFFYDEGGNRWEADEKGPKQCTISGIQTNNINITYHLAYENKKEQFIVTNNTEFNKILNDFATHTFDAETHDFYVIGRNFNTSTAEVSSTVNLNNLAGYTNELVDTFKLNGVTYTVSYVRFYHKWEEETCVHDWQYKEELHGNCSTAATTTVECKKCGKEVTVHEPALGHTDLNHDGICDRCNITIASQLGDDILVTWDSKDRNLGVHQYRFICVDDNYQGTGKMLYVSEDGIPSSIYGEYTSTDVADYDSSSLKAFLNDVFADGLSNKTQLQNIGDSVVTMLTADEYANYANNATNKYLFPYGTYLTRSTSGQNITLTNKQNISYTQAGNYEVHPVILLNKTDKEEGIVSGTWNIGDIQAKYIGNKLYLFRCVDDNFMDLTQTDKSMAVFLCDTVIDSKEGLGYNEADGTQSTRFFGDTNNYKYSIINDYLNSNKKQEGNMMNMNIGVKNEYTGSTQPYKYEKLTMKSLIRHERPVSQVMYSKLFIPSLEEAYAMKDYLWKVDGSDKNNIDTIINNYRKYYWLRTPVYGTTDMVYAVNMENGAIEPVSVKATENNDVSNVGIRPMYVVEQEV